MHVALWPLSKGNISWVAHSVLVTYPLFPLYLSFPDRPPEDETHALKSESNDNGISGKSVVLGKAGFTFNLSYLSFFLQGCFFKTTFLTNRGNIQQAFGSVSVLQQERERQLALDSWRNSALCQHAKATIMYKNNNILKSCFSTYTNIWLVNISMAEHFPRSHPLCSHVFASCVEVIK